MTVVGKPDRDEMRARHWRITGKDGSTACTTCGFSDGLTPAPCDVRLLLDALDEVDRTIEELRAEVTHMEGDDGNCLSCCQPWTCPGYFDDLGRDCANEGELDALRTRLDEAYRREKAVRELCANPANIGRHILSGEQVLAALTGDAACGHRSGHQYAGGVRYGVPFGASLHGTEWEPCPASADDGKGDRG